MNHNIKVTLLGESSVGKTSIILRLKYGTFKDQIESTIGASFYVIDYNGIKYDVFDCAGQERFRSLLPMYYRNSKILLLVFDVSNLDTLKKFDRFLRGASEHITNAYRVIIIGNKIDLVDKNKLHIVDKMVKNMTREYDICEYVYTSARTGENFDNLLNVMHYCGQFDERCEKGDFVKLDVEVSDEKYCNSCAFS